MKLIYTALLLALLNLNCKKDPKILFDFQYQQNISLKAGLSYVETHYFEFNDIQTNYKNLLKSHGYTSNQINKISPGSCYFYVLDSGINLDFIQEISIMISSTNVFNKEVFYTIQVPYNAGDRLDLAGTLVDAIDVLGQDRFNMRVAFKLRADCPATFDARFNLKFLAL